MPNPCRQLVGEHQVKISDLKGLLMIRVRLRQQTLLGFRLISEPPSASDCDIQCEGYGHDRHTSVFLQGFPFWIIGSWPTRALKITLVKHIDLKQPNMYASCCIIESTRLCAKFDRGYKFRQLLKWSRPQTLATGPSRLGHNRYPDRLHLSEHLAKTLLLNLINQRELTGALDWCP